MGGGAGSPVGGGNNEALIAGLYSKAFRGALLQPGFQLEKGKRLTSLERWYTLKESTVPALYTQGNRTRSHLKPWHQFYQTLGPVLKKGAVALLGNRLPVLVFQDAPAPCLRLMTIEG